MSRILFAAARGARIQTQYVFPKKYWGTCDAIRPDNFFPYRIHPDDEHLQYGPFSSDLIRKAEKPSAYPDACAQWIGVLMMTHATMTEYGDLHDRDAKSFALLFLAEYLADEGL